MDQQLSLQGLLKLSLAQQSSSDDTACSANEMTEENRDFIQKALSEMTVDVDKEFRTAISTLENSSASAKETLNALKIVREYVDNMDLSNNFAKAGGINILSTLLRSKDAEIRVAATYIIAEMSQNNPFCQKLFVEASVLPLLLSYCNEDNDKIASSALHAVSTLIRNFDQGLVEFLQRGGIKTIIHCLDTPHTRVFIKSCFIIACLSSQNAIVRDEFVKNQTIIKLLTFIEPCVEFDIKMETLLYALSELSKSLENQPNRLKLMESHKNVLQDIVQQNANIPQCEETVDYAKIILKNMA